MDSFFQNILLKLDYQFDIEMSEYFRLTEEQKNEITHIISDGLLQRSKGNLIHLHGYIATLEKIIRQCEEDEEYEKCELFIRIEKKLFNVIETMV